MENLRWSAWHEPGYCAPRIVEGNALAEQMSAPVSTLVTMG